MKSILTIGEILVEIMATEQGRRLPRAGQPRSAPFRPARRRSSSIRPRSSASRPPSSAASATTTSGGSISIACAATGSTSEGVRIDPETATGSAFVRYRPDGSRAFVFNIKHSASGAIALDARGASRSRPQRPPARDGNGAVLAEHRRGRPRGRRSGARRAAARSRSTQILRPEMLEPAGPSRGLRRPCSDVAISSCRAAPNSICSRKRRRRKPRSRKSSTAASGRSFTSAAPTARAISTRATRAHPARVRGRGGRSDRRGRLLRRHLRQLLAARTCRPPSAWPMPPRAEPWRSRGRDRWRAPRARPSSTRFWQRDPRRLAQ